jgi:hypothetical protein
MAATKKSAPASNSDIVVPSLDDKKIKELTKRVLSEAGGVPPNYTQTKITKVGASGYRVNVFAKLDTNPTPSIVFSKFYYDN